MKLKLILFSAFCLGALSLAAQKKIDLKESLKRDNCEMSQKNFETDSLYKFKFTTFPLGRKLKKDYQSTSINKRPEKAWSEYGHYHVTINDSAFIYHKIGNTEISQPLTFKVTQRSLCLSECNCCDGDCDDDCDDVGNMSSLIMPCPDVMFLSAVDDCGNEIIIKVIYHPDYERFYFTIYQWVSEKRKFPFFSYEKSRIVGIYFDCPVIYF